jgi:hypothetical protein
VDDAKFDHLFGSDALLGVTGDTIAMLEPIALCSMICLPGSAMKRRPPLAN